MTIDKRSLRSYNPTMTKKHIPRAMKEQLWIKKVGRVFEAPCNIKWCENNMTSFDFHVGHNVPESKGGKLEWNNLVPICCRCNLSMGSSHNIREWNSLLS